MKDARLSLTNFQQSYETNKATFIDYFESEQTVFKLEMDYAKLKNNYFTQLAKLNSLFEKGVIPHE